MANEKFPTTLLAAVRYFEDEAVCRDFLAGLRWPNGVACVACGSENVGFVQTRSLWRCRACRKEFSVKKGTIFEDSAIPLSKWLPAIWLYSAGKKGRSSHQLARDLGVTQKTAWFMGHRIRLAMEAESFNRPLTGEVEVDETFVGRKEKFKHAGKREHRGRGPSVRSPSWASWSGTARFAQLSFRAEGEEPYRLRFAPTWPPARPSTRMLSPRTRGLSPPTFTA
jgi:transposase-like protein